VRLFVAVEPPARVLDALDALPRSPQGSIRWTTRDQWHLTLRFLGEVEDAAPVIGSLGAMPSPGAVTAALAPRAESLRREVVCLPVHGLAELADAVTTATAELGRAPQRRQFRGHLTLARTRDKQARAAAELLPAVEGELVWDVSEIVLVRSTLRPTGAVYDIVHRHPLR
jgi:2'-5' RNA ligase